MKGEPICTICGEPIEKEYQENGTPFYPAFSIVHPPEKAAYGHLACMEQSRLWARVRAIEKRLAAAGGEGGKT